MPEIVVLARYKHIEFRAKVVLFQFVVALNLGHLLLPCAGVVVEISTGFWSILGTVASHTLIHTRSEHQTSRWHHVGSDEVVFIFRAGCQQKDARRKNCHVACHPSGHDIFRGFHLWVDFNACFVFSASESIEG